jgi:alpha-D-xyloside xylohydrolase
VYLPANARWRNAWTGNAHEGGTWITIEAPLHIVPLFVRDGGDLTIDSSWFER